MQAPTLSGPRLLWQYDQWLDANGNNGDEPSSDIFYGSDAQTLGQNQAASLVVLETSSLDDAQTDDKVMVALQFSDGTSTDLVEASTGKP